MSEQRPGAFKQILVPDVITVGYCETCMLLWQIDAFDCGIIFFNELVRSLKLILSLYMVPTFNEPK